MGRRRTVVPRSVPAPEPAPEPALVADPRPRSAPQLVVAVILYAVCLLALAILGIWG